MCKKIFYVSILLLTTFGCNSKSKLEQDAIQAYLSKNNITVSPTSSGLYYIETLKGAGVIPQIGSLVRINYKCMLLDGTIIDTNKTDEPLVFYVGYGQVIAGLDEGIKYMSSGGKATMIMPSDLAYGKTGKGKIPAYTPLIFEIELLSSL